MSAVVVDVVAQEVTVRAATVVVMLVSPARKVVLLASMLLLSVVASAVVVVLLLLLRARVKSRPQGGRRAGEVRMRAFMRWSCSSVSMIRNRLLLV